MLLHLASIAIASSGSASAPPPRPPAVDLSAVPASAAERKTGADGKAHPVLARLLSEADAVPAGSTVRVGLHLTQDEGWHTYWKAPGDIGLPTEITWTLPDGVTAGPHAFPVPQRFEQDGQVSFGYDREVLLISDLTIPAGLAPGRYDVTAAASWLVCKTSCIPGDATVTLPLEVAAAGGTPRPTPWAPLFPHYAAQHPVDPGALTGWSWQGALSVDAVAPNSTFRAAFLLQAEPGHTLAPPGPDAWPTFTPIAVSMDWMLDGLSVRSTPDGGILVVLDAQTFEPEAPPEGQTIGGLVQVQVDGQWVRTELSTPVPWVAPGATPAPTGSPLFALADAAPPQARGGAEEAVAPIPAAVVPLGGTGTGDVGLLFNLLMAFVGGLILNVMPCVLPVLTLKLYSLVEQGDIGAGERRTAGLAYSAGILASFWALAGAVVAARVVFGMEVDWGFQFQYPPYVAALATVVFAFGLSLVGVFDIPALGVGAADEAASREGVAGYFLTGVFATLLATPCSAPFLGTAIAYAFGAPTPVLLAIFSMVGLGLASPFLLIAFVPALYRFLPRPGEWMDVLKQVLGFSLLATTVWLVDVLIAQIGADRAIGLLAFLLAVGVGSWIFGRWGGPAESGARQAGAAVAGLSVAALAGVLFLDLALDTTPTCDDGAVVENPRWEGEIPWQPFSPARIDALAGKVVFVDFTADWCLSCKVNEHTVLESDEVRGAMERLGVVPLKADWTRRDPVITEWLHRFGRAGVPMYLVIPADRSREPILLPEVITPGMVIAALELAAG